MRARNEELLYFLLWSCERLFRPTFRNLTDSFEAWVYREGLRRELAALERRQLIESLQRGSNERLHRLTAQGRLLALGGRDPEIAWAQPWDGVWRLIAFDVPLSDNARRKQLVRYLHACHFGCLQRSVWISPHPLTSQHDLLADAGVKANAMILLEAQPAGGEAEQDIVRAAWDFERINRRYLLYLSVLEAKPAGAPRNEAAAMELRRWAAEERQAWWAAVSEDPLLPERLLPADYLGQDAWRQRATTLQRAAGQLEDFVPKQTA